MQYCLTKGSSLIINMMMTNRVQSVVYVCKVLSAYEVISYALSMLEEIIVITILLN